MPRGWIGAYQTILVVPVFRQIIQQTLKQDCQIAACYQSDAEATTVNNLSHNYCFPGAIIVALEFRDTQANSIDDNTGDNRGEILWWATQTESQNA